MKSVVIIGDMEIRAAAVSRGGDGFISAVTIVHRRGDTRRDIASHHEWDEPVFEDEAQALQFAWRRAALMASSLADAPRD